MFEFRLTFSSSCWFEACNSLRCCSSCSTILPSCTTIFLTLGGVFSQSSGSIPVVCSRCFSFITPRLPYFLPPLNGYEKPQTPPSLNPETVVSKLVARLQSNSTLKDQLDSNFKNPISVKIKLDGQEVFNSQNNPPVNNLSAEDLAYVEKALELKLGKAPDEYNRNVRVKLKDEEVFRLHEGVVKINEFQPAPIKESSLTHEASTQVESPPSTAPQTHQQTPPEPTATKPPIQDLNQGQLSPRQLQAERSQKIAPIVRAFLESRETHHLQGKTYTATWDKQNQTLALTGNNQLKMLAKFDKGQWQSFPIPLAENQPNLTETDLKHFEQLAPKIEAKRERTRMAYRQWYLDSKAKITEYNPSLRDATQVDLAVATAVLEQSGEPTDVGRILSQSDVAVAIRETEGDSYAATEKVYGYVNDLYKLATRELEQQRRVQQGQRQPEVEVEIGS